nr:MAG TPA: hypothetical protein [Caudoviricetes sp.]
MKFLENRIIKRRERARKLMESELSIRKRQCLF